MKYLFFIGLIYRTADFFVPYGVLGEKIVHFLPLNFFPKVNIFLNNGEILFKLTKIIAYICSALFIKNCELKICIITIMFNSDK